MDQDQVARIFRTAEVEVDREEFNAFVELVAQMRAAQKAYFDIRDRDALSRSKELEKQVDRTIESLTKPRLL